MTREAYLEELDNIIACANFTEGEPTDYVGEIAEHNEDLALAVAEVFMSLERASELAYQLKTAEIAKADAR